MEFYYRIKDYDGTVRNFKMVIDVDTFLDLWNDTKKRCYSLEPITRDQYYENIVGRTVLTYPVSKLTQLCTDKAATYEVYEQKRKQTLF